MNVTLREFRARARESLKGFWGLALVAFFVANVVSFIESGLGCYTNIFGYNTGIEVATTIVTIVELLIAGPLAVGLAKLSLQIVRKENPEISTLFSQFKSNFVSCFILNVLKMLFIVLWTFLMIIPGVVAYYRYSFAEYIMADDPSISPMDAIRLSKEMTFGRKWRLFLLDLSFIGWWLLSALSLGIGTLFLTPYVGISKAEFYRQTKAEYYNKDMGSAATKICPRCLAVTELSAKFCQKCGYHFYVPNEQNEQNDSNADQTANSGNCDNNDVSNCGANQNDMCNTGSGNDACNNNCNNNNDSNDKGDA